MKTLTMLLVILSATFAIAEEENEESKLFRAMGVGVWITQVTDLASTQYTIHSGGYEQNPLWTNDTARNTLGAAAKMGFAYGMNRATAHMYRHGKKKEALLIRIAIVSAFTYVSTKNLYIGMTIGK